MAGTQTKAEAAYAVDKLLKVEALSFKGQNKAEVDAEKAEERNNKHEVRRSSEEYQRRPFRSVGRQLGSARLCFRLHARVSLWGLAGCVFACMQKRSPRRDGRSDHV